MRFVLCHSYSGATLMSALLNTHPDLCSLGDMNLKRKFWEEDRACSCGHAIQSCSFWATLVERMGPEADFRDGHLLPLFPRLLTDEARNAWLARALAALLLVDVGIISRVARAPLMDYVRNYNRFYDVVLELQTKQHFVDGSKNLVGAVLQLTTQRHTTNHVIHLVRDPRAVYFSTLRHQRGVSPGQFAATWNRQNRVVTMLAKHARYLRVKYEDLCEEPEGTLDELSRFLGVGGLRIPDELPDYRRYHILGNQMINNFRGTITCDTTWKSELPRNVQRQVLRSTAPWSTRFKYE